MNGKWEKIENWEGGGRGEVKTVVQKILRRTIVTF